MTADDGRVPVGGRARALLRAGRELLGAARSVLREQEAAQREVRCAYEVLADVCVLKELEGLPLAALREVTRGQVREAALRALEAAGFGSVGQVRQAEAYALRQLPGIGAQTAGQLHSAAGQLARAAAESVAVRIDVDAQGDERHTALVRALNRMVLAGPGVPAAVALARKTGEALEADLHAAAPAASRAQWLLTGTKRRTAARDALLRVRQTCADAAAEDVRLQLDQAVTDLLRGPEPADRAWLDFQVRAAEYYTVLGKVADLPEDRESAEGFVPSSIAEEVRAQHLDESLLHVSLRSYQAFGARFALARRRVLLGDEMGLGKTIQALAALAHLQATGQGRHFLVVCPVGVLLNWIREIEHRSSLTAHRAHGGGRFGAVRAWQDGGGVLVTTYDVLRGLEIPKVPLAMVVADEAQYVKNPRTRRAEALAALIRRPSTGHVLFLTGTPMEHRVGEFRSLIGQLQSREARLLEYGAGAQDSRAFRAAVAPSYLRRNQPDVLGELPGVIHADEWEEFSDTDRAAYRRAVAEGNFMAMRRAPYADPARSAKLHRLRELIAEAAANELKVVVFSGFLDVLGAVAAALDGAALGPVTGAVPADERQALVDEFTAAPGHAVLLAQIRTGGTGLNLQAASVVVLCEPQISPALEAQAVARAHRMGQVRRVQVHRLLAADSIDVRLLEMHRAKQEEFDAYARRSEVAETVPEAVDVSDPELARRIVEDEQLRLALQA
ncbi:DEAD/DEAH box helicase [Streptomyces indicus]|uniref:Helicase conserved C-terminal domain-containing protein n=1 Tax=Streptomyces indicus TaxID=417292 RepID=A0A1G9DZG0_9ACTN|nr:DEAD/DEAH box helicase [Streptomyces indicus]SDK69255.1 Helicase conserved C-terminal domain-containing protein [Streptomyces indicus]